MPKPSARHKTSLTKHLLKKKQETFSPLGIFEILHGHLMAANKNAENTQHPRPVDLFLPTYHVVFWGTLPALVPKSPPLGVENLPFFDSQKNVWQDENSQGWLLGLLKIHNIFVGIGCNMGNQLSFFFTGCTEFNWMASCFRLRGSWMVFAFLLLLEFKVYIHLNDFGHHGMILHIFGSKIGLLLKGWRGHLNWLIWRLSCYPPLKLCSPKNGWWENEISFRDGPFSGAMSVCSELGVFGRFCCRIFLHQQKRNIWMKVPIFQQSTDFWQNWHHYTPLFFVWENAPNPKPLLCSKTIADMPIFLGRTAPLHPIPK